MKDRETTGFPAKMDRAAALLASGLTVRAAAAKVSVNERTVHTWRDDPAFVKLVATYQAKLISRSLAKLAGAASRAVKTLVDCLKSNESDSVKVRSAVAILDQLMKIREITALEERINELKKRLPDEH
jgi:hypothetical protein